MKTNHTDITVVLDRSGSMQVIANDTIGGFNRFLADQRSVTGTANITLYQFDDKFETVINNVDIKSAQDLTSQTFVPRGGTALLDAIGRAVVDTGVRLKAAGNDCAEKVVFVIITDGYENASHEYTYTKISEMIEHQRAVYKWEFVFLGANQDAIKVAANLGVAQGNSMTYAANSVGVSNAFDATSANLVAFRSCANSSMAYSKEDREAQRKAGIAH